LNKNEHFSKVSDCIYRLKQINGKSQVTAQVDRLKAEDCQRKAYFEAMFGARIRHFRQSMAIVLFCTLQFSV
jgi:hypothetical protein